MKLPKNFNIVGTELYPYQLESAVFGMVQPNTGLLLDLGLGKTLIAITIARYRIQQNNINKVLVICPSSLLYNWKAQIEKFSEYEALIVTSSDRSERALKALSRNHKFHIMNYESVYPLLRDLTIIKELGSKYEIGDLNILAGLHYKMIIFDESARYLKNFSTKRVAASTILADYADYKLILTGTLIANRPYDLWSQFRILDGGKTFFKNPYVFRNKFFDKIGYKKFNKLLLKKQYIPFFQKAIYSSCIRFTKQEVAPDLPEQIFHIVEIEMPKELKDIYESVKSKIMSEITTLEGTMELTIINILAKFIRLQQITSGFVSTGKGKEKELLHTPKLDALMEEVESIIENDEHVVIWCKFHKSIDMISNTLKSKKIKHSILDGRVTNKDEKYKRWKSYQEDENMHVFVGQKESGGFGIELFKMESSSEKYQHDITYEDTFSYDVSEQAQGRIHRLGQKSTCRYVNLLLKDTIDEKIYKSRLEKKKLIDEIMNVGPVNFLQEN